LTSGSETPSDTGVKDEKVLLFSEVAKDGRRNRETPDMEIPAESSLNHETSFTRVRQVLESS